MKFFKKINLKKIITHNLWLKLVSLFIAAIIWFYFSIEMTKGIKI